MTQQMEQAPDSTQSPNINIRIDRGLPLKWKLVGGVALAGVLVAGAGQFMHIPGIPKLGDYMTTTVTPEHTSITAKTLKIIPVNFDCKTMAAYDAGDQLNASGDITTKGSEAAVKTHGFVHAAHANKAKVVATICATDVKVTEKPALNVASNTVEQDVSVNVDSLVVNTQFSEPDTLIVDNSGGWTELLSGGAQAGDSIIDGVCQIVTLWNCDKGLANPGDAAVKTSHEDQAKTEQYLRIKILETVQDKCLAGDWEQFKLAIVDAYKKQALPQGVTADSVRIHFVDSNGNEVTSTPDFTHKAIQALIDSGAISGAMPDVEIINEAKTEVNCTSLVPTITGSDLSNTATSGIATR